MSFIVDIETASKPENELSGLVPKFEAPSNWKDPEKINAAIEQKKKEWLEDGALHANTGIVLVVGILESDSRNITILEGEESSIIKGFWDFFSETTDMIVGHNIKGFDVPFILRRSWLLGIQTPVDIVRGRYINDRFIDTMERWACGTRDTISLDNLSKAFGLPGKSGSGKDFAGQYMLGGDFKKKALDYLRNDLLMTHAVAKGMGMSL